MSQQVVLAYGIAALCAAACLAMWLAQVIARHRFRRVIHRRASRAREGEDRAEDLLVALGYDVTGRQVALSWTIECDGEAHPVELRADLVVERDGEQMLAEVKTGTSAPLLTNAATRRQLLEYAVAFGSHSILLVDVEAEEVREVSFTALAPPSEIHSSPEGSRSRRRSGKPGATRA